ncbi:hypothetical protein U14_01841 [Candidatus Moduliflexus flocculans]|uniref:Uncharacterized protein n=1 Tax=Candidatus Moduliflexus flocculans TaxID=1499966 RepID=A0A0S6VT54_9BACT|nr:hypothetical protein U14_01841 [Candidatus Moduliflexus flocculans]
MKIGQRSLMMSLAAVIVGLVVLMASAQSAHADTTQTMKYLQGFGEDSSNGMNFKILVQSYESGDRYFIWYYYSLNLVDGQDVVITFDNWGDWKTISNLLNGKEQPIKKAIKVE